MSDSKAAMFTVDELEAAIYAVWAYHWEGSDSSSATAGAHGHTGIDNRTWKVYDPMLPNGLAAAIIEARRAAK
jgi:hypothetical protein